MKKTILFATGFAVLTAGGYCSYLFAQGGNPPATTQAQPGTKVAVVNIGHVFNKYNRAIAFKTQLEREFEPFKAKAKKLTDEMKTWEDEMRNPKATPKDVETRQEYIKRNKRDLEDLGVEMQRMLGKKQEENLVTLWKEVNMGISKVSEAYGFQIVFGFGDPLDKALMDLFPNINRKMQAMDGGAAVPLYVHGSVDLSHAVTETLNRWTNPTTTDPKLTPTGGNK